MGEVQMVLEGWQEAGRLYGCDKCRVHLYQGACFQAYHQHAQLDAA